MVLNLTASKFENDKARFAGGTVRKQILNFRQNWDRLSVASAVFSGIALGFALEVVPHVAFGWPASFPGFFVYFPFHVWLCYLAFSVLLSSRRRADVMGEGYSPMGAFFALFLTTKYGLFCFSWFFTMWLSAALIIGV